MKDRRNFKVPVSNLSPNHSRERRLLVARLLNGNVIEKHGFYMSVVECFSFGDIIFSSGGNPNLGLPDFVSKFSTRKFWL